MKTIHRDRPISHETALLYLLRMSVILFLASPLACGKKGPPTGKAATSEPATTAKSAVEESRPWRPPEAMLGRLDPEIEVGDYLVRPPRGFLKKSTSVGKIRMDTWENL